MAPCAINRRASRTRSPRLAASRALLRWPYCLDGQRRRAPTRTSTSQSSDSPGRSPRRRSRCRRGVGAHAARPGEVVGQRRAQFGAAARVGVAERVVRARRSAPAGRRRASAARGNADRSGVTGAQVVADGAGLGPVAAAGGDGSTARSATCVPDPVTRGQPPLRDELAVRVDDRVAGDPEVECQRRARTAAGCRAAGGRSGRPPGARARVPARPRLPASSRCRSMPKVAHALSAWNGPYSWADLRLALDP